MKSRLPVPEGEEIFSKRDILNTPKHLTPVGSHLPVSIVSKHFLM